MQIKTLLSGACIFLAVEALPEVFMRGAATTACNANNCLRAVRATAPASRLEKASADCSSFLKTTVTPCPVTSTLSVYQTTSLPTVTATTLTTSTSIATSQVTTITTSYRVLPALAKRVSSSFMQQAPSCPVTTAPAGPTAIPAYASPCSSVAAYSSACSCLGGIDAATITLDPVTVWVTATNTLTSSPSATATSVIKSASTTTVIIATSVIGGQAACTPGTILNLRSPSPPNGIDLPLNLYIRLNPSDPCLYDGGIHLSNACGVVDGNPISFNIGDSLGGADQCYYPNRTPYHLSSPGITFRAQDAEWNLYSDNILFNSIDMSKRYTYPYSTFQPVSCDSYPQEAISCLLGSSVSGS